MENQHFRLTKSLLVVNYGNDRQKLLLWLPVGVSVDILGSSAISAVSKSFATTITIMSSKRICCTTPLAGGGPRSHPSFKLATVARTAVNDALASPFRGPLWGTLLRVQKFGRIVREEDQV